MSSATKKFDGVFPFPATHHTPFNPAAAQVHEFHTLFEHPIAYTPQEPPNDLKLLRLRCLAEELTELAAAWGVDLDVSLGSTDDDTRTVYNSRDISLKGLHPVVAAADAMADLLYFLHGTALVSGTPLQAVQDAVHAANMRKVGPDGKVHRRADGKVLKPDGWQPPDIAEVLRKYGWV